MSTRRSENAPWPRQTQPPSPHKSHVKRRKIEARQALQPQVEEAEEQCEILSGNNIESCFPNATSVFAQSEFVSFVWNSRLPSLVQTNMVNIYLFHADSGDQVLEVLNYQNPTDQAGHITLPANDSWWGTNGPDYSGTNTSYSFYFAITPNTTTFDGSVQTQTHFVAVQTTFPDSIISSMSSSSSASAAAAAASRSSASSSASTSASPTGSPGTLQSDSANQFPHWAIAVIVVLGFLAIASSCLLAFFIARRLRRRRELAENRNSMGSASPMMAHVQSPGSPLLAGGAVGATSSSGHGATGVQRAPSVVSPDGASSISHGGSAGEGGPFSGADAAIIANAFRTMLRKPDFADAPMEEGESPDSQERGRAELSRELAEEGRDIRSVSSSRGVKVETLSDDGTIQDAGH